MYRGLLPYATFGTWKKLAFANIRIKNEIIPGVEGGVTKFFESDEQMSIYDAAIEYEKLIRSAFDCASLVTGQVCDEEDENDDEENHSDILGENPRNQYSSRVKPQKNSEILEGPQILGSAEALGDMSRMSIDKQEEYKRLLEVVTNKEKAETAQVSTQSSLNPLAPIFLPMHKIENQNLTQVQGRHGEFEPGKAQYSTPNFFDQLFLIRAY